jgi:hypothetical protein
MTYTPVLQNLPTPASLWKLQRKYPYKSVEASADRCRTAIRTARGWGLVTQPYPGLLRIHTTGALRGKTQSTAAHQRDRIMCPLFPLALTQLLWLSWDHGKTIMLRYLITFTWLQHMFTLSLSLSLSLPLCLPLPLSSSPPLSPSVSQSSCKNVEMLTNLVSRSKGSQHLLQLMSIIEKIYKQVCAYCALYPSCSRNARNTRTASSPPVAMPLCKSS